EHVEDDGALAGVALVVEPEQYPLSLFAYPRLARGALASGWRGVQNLLRIDASLQRPHPKTPHHYLFVLGVLPEMQGRGVAGALGGAVVRGAAPAPSTRALTQPPPRLHGQLDAGGVSRASKIQDGEPCWLHPADAAAPGVIAGDVVEVFSDRGRCLAGVVVT